MTQLFLQIKLSKNLEVIQINIRGQITEYRQQTTDMQTKDKRQQTTDRKKQITKYMRLSNQEKPKPKIGFEVEEKTGWLWNQ